VSDPIDELRAVAAATAAAPPPMEAYLEKVRACAYTISDAEVEMLKDAGISEDVIFEQTVAAAIQQGLDRLDRAAEVIG
jgi:hypothetical protein